MNQIPVHLIPFQNKEHQPFFWNGGQPAALLVHGFPGTPAEMRPLAAVLHESGWTVHAPLLPGFGPDIATLFERDHTEWVNAVQSALAELRQRHQPVLLVGHSMGGALALQVGAHHPPDGLVLTAPFWQLGEWWQRWIGLLLKPFVRRLQPFKTVDFTNPDVRQAILNFMPGLDLDDPDLQAEIRDFALPTRIFEQLLNVGKKAYRLASQINSPTLIVQGTQDETVPANRTRRLLKQFSRPVRYEEIPTGHDLTRAHDPGWPAVERIVLEFTGILFERSLAKNRKRGHHGV